jgi:hypothetical protein
MALTWGVVFGGIAFAGMLAARAMQLSLPWPEEATSMLVVASRWAFIGVMGGVLFGLTVIAAGKRRTLFEMSVRRFGAWGFGIGAAVPLVGAALFAGVDQVLTPEMLLSAIPVSLACGAVSGIVAAASLEAARSSGRLGEQDTPTTLPPVV